MEKACRASSAPTYSEPCTHGPVIANVMPGVWMLTNTVQPSGLQHAPQNSVAAMVAFRHLLAGVVDLRIREFDVVLGEVVRRTLATEAAWRRERLVPDICNSCWLGEAAGQARRITG